MRSLRTPTWLTRILTLCLIATLSWQPSSAYALDLTPPEIEQTIKLLQGCNRALNACNAESETQSLLIARYREQNALLANRVIELESGSLTSNPLLWFIGGMLVTGLTVRLVK